MTGKKLVTLTLIMLFVLALMVGVVSASDFVYKSTNEENREANLPHVNVVGVGQDWIEFDFVNPTQWIFAFEYRVDGEDTPSPGYVHPITGGDYYHTVNVDGRVGVHLVNMTINADEKVEVRLALGAENDWYFDWITFYVEPAIEYEAAPAVAARLLDDEGVDNRYGQGRSGGNYIADVARHMGDNTDFDGVSKENVGAYECAVAAFLNDPANGEHYPAGVVCTPQYETLESVFVYAINSTPTLSTKVLESGASYRLIATGVADAGDSIYFDASYSITTRIIDDTWTNTVTGYESWGEELLGLHVDGMFPDWGEYNDNNTYYLDYVGTGDEVALWIWDIYYPNNSGYLTVEIQKVNW